MICPQGAFVLEMDTNITGNLDALLAASVGDVISPAVTSVGLFLIVRGVEMGLTGRGWDAPRDVLRVMLLLMMATRIDLLNTWLRDFLFTALPGGLMATFAGRIAGSAVVIDGTNAAAAAFNAMCAQTHQVLNQSRSQSALGILDVSNFSLDLWHTIANVCIMVMAISYAVSKFLLALLVVFSPYVFALDIHKTFQGLSRTWLGLCLGFVGTLVGLVVMLQFAVNGSLTYVDRIIAAQRLYEETTAGLRFWQFGQQVQAANAAMATTIDNVKSMALWLMAWTVAVAAVSALFARLFGGIAPRLFPQVRQALYTTAQVAAILEAFRSPGPAPLAGLGAGGGSAPNLSLSLAPKAIPGAGGAGRGAPPALPAPPVPLHQQGRPII